MGVLYKEASRATVPDAKIKESEALNNAWLSPFIILKLGSFIYLLKISYFYVFIL